MILEKWYHLFLSSSVDVVWRADQKYYSMQKCGIAMYEFVSLFARQIRNVDDIMACNH